MKKKHPSPEEKIKIVEARLAGNSAEHLAKIFKCTPRSIQKWVNEAEEGFDFIRRNNPGSGRPTKLDMKSGEKLLSMIKYPASEFGFESDLWNTSRLQIIFRKNLKINLSKMAIWRYLKKFENSYKKTQKQYYETSIDKQNEWRKEVLPKIKKTIKKYKAILYFEDESNIALSPEMGKSWGPIGEKIIHKVTGNRGSLSAISAISSDGRLIFNIFDGNKRFKSADIIIFLKRMLAEHPRRHLVVVMDRATAHTSKLTKKFILEQKRLHVFYLPPRSPEFNPDEQVWGYLKNHGLRSHQATNLKDLKKIANKKLNNLSKDENKVRGVFKGCRNFKMYL